MPIGWLILSFSICELIAGLGSWQPRQKEYKKNLRKRNVILLQMNNIKVIEISNCNSLVTVNMWFSHKSLF